MADFAPAALGSFLCGIYGELDLVGGVRRTALRRPRRRRVRGSTAVFMTSPAAAGALAVQPTGGSVRRDTDFVVPLGGTYAVAPDHTERSIDALMDSGIRAVFGYGVVKPP